MPVEPVGQWARTAPFDEPIDLGAVERDILARPIPVPERTAEEKGSPVAEALVGVFFMLPLAALPLLGYVFLWGASRESDLDVADSLLIAASVSSLLGIALPGTAILLWGLTRQRSAFIAAAVVMPIVSIATVFLLLSQGIPVTTFALVGSAATLVLSLVLCALVFLATKPSPPDETDQTARENAARVKERTIVLHVLRDRGLIDVATYQQAIDMPLGSWGGLGTVDR
ncbi:hypothetical protein ACH0AH_02515 [Microbacterium paludicola]|uniref:hypothetical protein n=1 Tax=Microbacterium paludicola TaxID=300019 RepID=UPI00387A7A86